jgi:hypothetical protein
VSQDVESKDAEVKNVELNKTEVKDVESKHAEVKVLGLGRDEITKAHTFFAYMGGFIAKIRVLSRPQQGESSSNKPDETSSVPETSQVIIREVEDCRDLGQYYILSASDTHSYRLRH